MGEEIEFENGPKWSNFRLSWAPDFDLDLGSGHGHYLFFISHRVLPVYQISSKSKKLFVDGRTYVTHGRTDVRTDGNLTPILLGRLPKFGSRPNKDKLKKTKPICSEETVRLIGHANSRKPDIHISATMTTLATTVLLS